ncbi:MAG TPA: hypothetical protein VNA16_05250 [Abditibacteriaceae bacterium]|nr:hypothetical protein [Abditibacteriaceae bacterium]
MQKRPPGFYKPAPASADREDDENPHIEGATLPHLIESFLDDCAHRNHSPRTLEEERSVLEKFLRYLRETGATVCGEAEIRAFTKCERDGGMQRKGRLGRKAASQPIRPRIVKNH